MSTRTMIGVLAAAAFLEMTAILSFILLIPSIAADFNASVAVVAQITTMTLVVGIAFGLLLGPLADHFGLRRAMLAGALLIALSSFGTTISTGFWVLLLSRLPVGLGVMGAVTFAIAASRLPEEHRRNGIGWIASLTPLAPIIGSPIIGLIAHYFHWRVSYAVLGIIFLGLLVVIWRLLPTDPPWPSSRFNARDVFLAYGPILRNQASVLLYLADIFRGVPLWGITVYISAWLVQAHGLTLQHVSFVYTAVGAAYVLGTRFGIGENRWMSLPTILIASTLAMTAFAALSMSGLFGLYPSLALLMLFALTGGAGFPAITIMISEESRGGQGTTMMLRRVCVSCSQALGASLGGAFLASGGFQLLGYGVIVFGIASAAVVVAARRLSLPRTAETAVTVGQRAG